MKSRGFLQTPQDIMEEVQWVFSPPVHSLRTRGVYVTRGCREEGVAGSIVIL